MYSDPKVEPPTPAPSAHEVEVSAAGRALAARDGASGSSTLSPERLAELRRRVHDGTYDSPAVIDDVARRILAKGDL